MMKKVCAIAVVVISAQGYLFGAAQEGVAPSNTLEGYNALASVTGGVSNSAFGNGALKNITNSEANSAFGMGALANLKEGDHNTAIGLKAGGGLVKGSNNIYIDARADAKEENDALWIGDSQKTCHIAGIAKAEPGKGSRVVVIDDTGKLAAINVSADELQNLIKSKGK